LQRTLASARLHAAARCDRLFELYGLVEEIIRPPVDARSPILWVTEVGQQDAFQARQFRLTARSDFQRVFRQADNFNAVKIID